MSTESLRSRIAELSASAGVLAALGAELGARAAGKAIHPNVRPHVEAILQKAGVADAMDGLTAAEIKSLANEIRHFWSLDGEFLSAPDRTPGWTYADTEILSTGGELTEGFALVLPKLAPVLDGLAAGLEGPGGRFLDVGTGTGRLAIGMARGWPALHVVGIDSWAPSLALARAGVAAASLEDRIELREHSAEELDDESSFDLAWIPAPFMPPDILQKIVKRVHRALKPGGWLLFATARPGTDMNAALMGLRVATWGGQLVPQDEIERFLADAQFTDVRVLPGPPRDFKMIVAGRRPKNS